jgi:hypothetical protein
MEFTIYELIQYVLRFNGSLMTYQVPYFIQKSFGVKKTTSQCRNALKKLKNEGVVENALTGYKKQLCWKIKSDE